MITDSLQHNFGGHGGAGHISPTALDYFKNKFDVKTMLDVGCGSGLNCAYATEVKGIKTTGLEADHECRKFHKDIIIHDFEKQGKWKHTQVFDLGWSIGVSEHIESKNADDYVDSFKSCKWIIMTWCPPGYGGHHHVNEQPADYWIEKFKKHGFDYHEDITKEVLSRARGDLLMIKNRFWDNDGVLKKKKAKMYLSWGLVFSNPTLR